MSTRNGIGAVPLSTAGAHFPVAVKLRLPCTNDMAEYKACNTDLKATLDMNVKNLEVYGDFVLIIVSPREN